MEYDFDVVVTKHTAFAQLVRERGMVGADTPVLSKVHKLDVADKDVLGTLPVHLAAEAKSITTIRFKIPPNLRGRELPLEELRKYAGEAHTFVCRDLEYLSDEERNILLR